MAEAKAKAGLPELQEVESNHNSLTAPKPVGVAFLAERPDYNPMRRGPNSANVKTDVTNTRDTANELVEAKGDRPYRATVEAESPTIADTSAAPDKVKEGAKAVSVEAAREPNVYRDTLPVDLDAATAPASDAGTQS